MNTTTDRSLLDSDLSEGLGMEPDRAAFERWLNPGQHAGNVSPWMKPGRYEKAEHQLAWLAWRAAMATERERPRQVIAYMATNREGEMRFTDSPDAARELEGYGWAITPLADAGPNAELSGAARSDGSA